MAYSLGERFSKPPKYFRIYDPGAYDTENKLIKPNKAPFLSKSPRKTARSNVWTHAIYDSRIVQRIPNCSSIMSKIPRFPYEALSAEDLEEILCKCAIQNACDCLAEDDERHKKPVFICQGKVIRRIFKGPPPRSVVGDLGLSSPCRRDRGFDIGTDGSQKRIMVPIKDQSPPFYDTRVNEATAFYQGWKWSKWKSKRSQAPQEERPGPADYVFKHKPTEDEICVELVRAHKRKTSKQLRYIEMVQEKNIRDNQPGPASYSPKFPKSTDAVLWKPTPERFLVNTSEVRPGPADHYLRRDFDQIDLPEKQCHAILPDPAPFGVKANRFKPTYEKGASPASYDTQKQLCMLVHCPKAPFGCSAKRFSEIKEDEGNEDIDEDMFNEDITESSQCSNPTWGFKSRTIRMKPLVKKLDEPSPADLPMTTNKIEKSPELQRVAPFLSSEGRFRAWCDRISVYGRLSTPGPGYYDYDKPKCVPAFNRGPLFRTERFQQARDQNPAPNEYCVGGGIETILSTHNERLNYNIQNQHTFHWHAPSRFKPMTLQEQKNALIENILLIFDDLAESTKNVGEANVKQRSTLLKTIENAKS